MKDSTGSIIAVRTAPKRATENWELVQIEFHLNDFPGCAFAVCTQGGKDEECWAGHYGSRFKEEQVYVEIYEPTQNI